MTELLPLQYVLIGLTFIWGGFVRSGLGFGGSVLTLPFLLLIYNEPLVFMPIISVHLLVFASITIVSNNRKQLLGASRTEHSSTVDWAFLKRIMKIMIVPKLVGVFGLITLPGTVLSLIIFFIVGMYSVGYILNRPFQAKSKAAEILFLVLGAYMSGTSLIGGPLIIAVALKYVPKHQMRDTLLALWFILVTIKMAAFIWAGVDLQLIHHLWLLPCATIGHFLGLRAHQKILQAETPIFFRLMGSALLTVSIVGFWAGMSA